MFAKQNTAKYSVGDSCVKRAQRHRTKSQYELWSSGPDAMTYHRGRQFAEMLKFLANAFGGLADKTLRISDIESPRATDL